jgi:hypothetical protein
MAILTLPCVGFRRVADKKPICDSVGSDFIMILLSVAWRSSPWSIRGEDRRVGSARSHSANDGMGLKSNMPREQKGAGLFEAAGREAGSPARPIP